MRSENDMKLSKSVVKPGSQASLRLKFLSQEQIVRINEMLKSVGEYGEVHLVIQKGELCFIKRSIIIKLER